MLSIQIKGATELSVGAVIYQFQLHVIDFFISWPFYGFFLLWVILVSCYKLINIFIVSFIDGKKLFNLLCASFWYFSDYCVTFWKGKNNTGHKDMFWKF